MHGQGTLTASDGTKYVGEWKDGKRVENNSNISNKCKLDHNKGLSMRGDWRRYAWKKLRAAG